MTKLDQPNVVISVSLVTHDPFARAQTSFGKRDRNFPKAHTSPQALMADDTVARAVQVLTKGLVNGCGFPDTLTVPDSGGTGGAGF